MQCARPGAERGAQFQSTLLGLQRRGLQPRQSLVHLLHCLDQRGLLSLPDRYERWIGRELVVAFVDGNNSRIQRSKYAVQHLGP